MSTAAVGEDLDVPSSDSRTPVKCPEFVRLREVVERARAGDQSVKPELEEALAKNESLWRIAGDLHLGGICSWVRRITGDDLLRQQATIRVADELERNLVEDGDGRLERLLIQRIVLDWLQVSYCENTLTQNREPALPIVRFLEQRTDRSHRRFLESVSTLTKVRKLSPRTRKSTKDEPHGEPKEARDPWNGSAAVSAINRFAGLWAMEPCGTE